MFEDILMLHQSLAHLHCTSPIRVIDEETAEIIFEGRVCDCKAGSYKVISYYPDYEREGNLVLMYLTFEVVRTEEKLID